MHTLLVMTHNTLVTLADKLWLALSHSDHKVTCMWTSFQLRLYQTPTLSSPIIVKSVKNGLSDPTKVQEGQNWLRNEVKCDCQAKALKEGCREVQFQTDSNSVYTQPNQVVSVWVWQFHQNSKPFGLQFGCPVIAQTVSNCFKKFKLI